MSFRTTAAARQNEMNASMAVVATSTRGTLEVFGFSVIEWIAIGLESIDVD
jgi:hypothetical protein